MQDVFIIEALRTPFGSLGGALAEIEAPQLAATVIRALVERTEIAPDVLDGVIIGQVLTGGSAQAPARQAMRRGGVPDRVPAMTINKVCGSGLQALMLGADAMRLGDADLLIAGGMENMSLAPYLLKKGRFGYRLGAGELLDLMIHDGLQDPYSGRHMGEIAEGSAERHRIGRGEQDEFAERSYRRAQAAVGEGILAGEIVPVVKKERKGEVTVADDEEPFKVDFPRLPQLKAVFKQDGTITAGNASTINDGAALCLLASATAVKKYDLEPKARLVAYASHSLHPDHFAEAPVGAMEKACARAGIRVSDIDLFEINEAFAAVPLIAMKQLELDSARVNVNGGAVALGHPLGASGGRLAATLVRELQRRKARYGLATLCIGGGEAVAAVFERV